MERAGGKVIGHTTLSNAAREIAGGPESSPISEDPQ